MCECGWRQRGEAVEEGTGREKDGWEEKGDEEEEGKWIEKEEGGAGKEEK